MASAPQTVPHDPLWLAHRHVEGADAIRFIAVPRAARLAVPFLTDEYLGPAVQAVDVPIASCLAQPAPASLHFLFHAAFCGSTLLAHALDSPGIATGLSEPVLLNDLVGFRLRGGAPGAVARLGDAALRLLARPWQAGEAVVVKPSNLANPFAPLLLALAPQARGLFLYAPLETFLISVAGKGLNGRLWVRELLHNFLKLDAVGLGFTAEDHLRHTDLQVAAVCWLAQQRQFGEWAGKFPDRLASLDSEQLMANPAGVLEALAAHYGLGADRTAIRALASGPAFTSHSKSGAAYSAERRAADYAAIRAAHADEITKVVVWAEAVAVNAGLPLTPPLPLPVA
jgi:hypothetical protein